MNKLGKQDMAMTTEKTREKNMKLDGEMSSITPPPLSTIIQSTFISKIQVHMHWIACNLATRGIAMLTDEKVTQTSLDAI